MEQSIDGLFDKLKYLIPLSSQNVRLTDKNNSLISIPGAVCSLRVSGLISGYVLHVGWIDCHQVK